MSSSGGDHHTLSRRAYVCAAMSDTAKKSGSASKASAHTDRYLATQLQWSGNTAQKWLKGNPILQTAHTHTHRVQHDGLSV